MRARFLLRVAVLAGVGMLVAVSVAAAVRVPLSWTAPDSVRSIEVRARRPDGVVLALSPFADSSGAASPAIAPAGTRQRVWVLISEDWRSGGWLLQIRSCNGAGCSLWSNAALVAAGVPDTLWALWRPDGAASVRVPRDSTLWKTTARGRVEWSLAFGDTAAAAVVHQEIVQRQWSARACELYGYWGLRGVREVCP